MSRADVLVDAGWAEAHLDDPKVVFVEVGDDVSFWFHTAARVSG